MDQGDHPAARRRHDILREPVVEIVDFNGCPN
jgi:hypothetical protein